VRNGPTVVVRGRDVVVSGTGPVGYKVEIQVDGIVVATVPITAPNGNGSGAWSYTLPSLAPGEREIATTYVVSDSHRSAPSAPVKVIIVAPAPLDFVGVGDTAITAWRKTSDSIRFKIRRASSAEWTAKTIRGRHPVVADYDDDGVSDLGAVRVRKGSLEWTVEQSSTDKAITTTLGEAGDTILSGCNFVSGKGASLAVFKSGQRTLQYQSVGDSAARTVTLQKLGSCNLIGCGDTDGDGVDEMLFTTRGADNRVEIVGYDTKGVRKFESQNKTFSRGLVVNRPDSPVPLVAVVGGPGGKGRQVRVTTMAGSFAFPLFYVSRDATIGTGTFLTETNQQAPGIFWSSRTSRRVYRRFLAADAVSRELFTLPKGYSLVRSQSIIRTERGG
jgi:hypothetical protein